VSLNKACILQKSTRSLVSASSLRGKMPLCKSLVIVFIIGLVAVASCCECGIPHNFLLGQQSVTVMVSRCALIIDWRAGPGISSEPALFNFDLSRFGITVLPRWRHYSNEYGLTGHIHVPLWVPLAAAALLRARSIRRKRLRLQAAAATCERCGYSLVGLPSPIQCPECGNSEAVDLPLNS